MTISSLLPGRVPNSLASDRLISFITRTQTDLTRLQDQLGSGQKFTLPSESPTAAIQTLVLQKLSERREAFQSNILTNRGFLNATDQALAATTDAADRARGLLLTGLGDQSSESERVALAQEVGVLIDAVLRAGNTTYQNRSLFAGSETSTAPFERINGTTLRYNGNRQTLSGFADFGTLIPSSINGADAFLGLTSSPSADLDAALTLDTRLDLLHSGRGIQRGNVEVTVVNGASTIRKTVDLSTAETIQDVKTRIEDAFAAEAVTVAVAIDPGTDSGLRLTPSAGTIAVSDIEGGTTAYDLGIRSGAVAVLNGGDVDVGISEATSVASLHLGAGIGATTGTGLRIVNGDKTSIIDLDGAATLGDLLNRIRAADSDLVAEISDDQRGIVISTRLIGTAFSIGENGGTNATQLGIRTLTATTRLADLNDGAGVPTTNNIPLRITRRDGSQVSLDLAAATTVQDVLNAINAVDPGHLTASLNAVGNGIALTDDSGTGSLIVDANEVATGLGIAGTESTGTAGVLAGADVNPQRSTGLLSLLVQMQGALETNDRATLNRIGSKLDTEASRLTVIRGSIGSSGRLLDEVDSRLEDAHVETKAQLSQIFDVDFAEAITRFLQQQQTLQATMQIASQSMQLSILQYL